MSYEPPPLTKEEVIRAGRCISCTPERMCRGCSARRAEIDKHAPPPRTAAEIRDAVQRSWAALGTGDLDMIHAPCACGLAYTAHLGTDPAAAAAAMGRAGCDGYAPAIPGVRQLRLVPPLEPQDREAS